MTREEIEKLEEPEPYCFETNKEEQWYKVGLKEGLETADNNPKWISVNDSLPCDFENLLENEILTVKVLVVLQWNEDPARKHIEICDMCNTIGSFKVDWLWNCSDYYTVTHWIPLPNFPKDGHTPTAKARGSMSIFSKSKSSTYEKIEKKLQKNLVDWKSRCIFAACLTINN